MTDSGIIPQYGFLYQRKAFTLYVMENIGVKQLFTFEGKDDIEIAVDEEIYAIQDSGGRCIQVKSGHVNESCFSRVICNWLLVDTSKTSSFELALEYDLPFDYSSKERASTICDFIMSGKDKKKSSIARKAYDKYKDQLQTEHDIVLKQIETMITDFKKTVRSMDEIDRLLEEIFYKHYCPDINDYEIAKTKRLERFLSYINSGIDDAIKIRKPYILLYQEFMRLIVQVTEEISDKKYIMDIKYLKNKSKETAQQIVKERASREVEQLYLVDNKESFVVDGIVHELIYKDFRSVYEQKHALEISNLEQTAKANFESEKFVLEEGDSPKKLYIKTIDRQIESNLLPAGPIYRKGCYIYLTGDDIEEDIQITWGENNDNE